MDNPISETEARFALTSIEQRRLQVMAEIKVPTWYWFLVAAGWVGLGVIADFGPAWATIAATLIFGAAHSTIAPMALSGRRGSPRLTIRRDLVSHRIQLYVIGFLIIMTAATVGFALLLNADGTRHPATFSSLVVAIVVLVGGPALISWVRRREERS